MLRRNGPVIKPWSR